MTVLRHPAFSRRRALSHGVSRLRLLRVPVVSVLAVTAAAGALTAQRPGTPGDSASRDSTRQRITSLGAVTVTATRTAKDVFDTPAPIALIDSTALRNRLANTPIDLFRELPGLDINGVGTNQARPTIRGLRGQRILLLEDGLRLNNSRRQQDFGELPAVAGIAGVDRVEVVRGPASVLYGTDAIGGVVNIITAGLPAAGGDGIRGWAGFRYSTADEQRSPSFGVQMRSGKFGLRLAGAYRDAESYEAPSGSFGDVSVERAVRVNDTGVRDYSFSLNAGWDVARAQTLYLRAERYRAHDAGFGFVEGADLGQANAAKIRITYPDQTVSRYSLGWRGSGIRSPVADRVDVSAYLQDNERDLDLDVFVPFGRGLPPTAGVTSESRNFTDLRTVGVRAEAAKLIAGRHVLTYGVDAFRDRSDNTDSSRTVVTGFGPPQTDVSTRAQVPNASLRSAGLFAQGDLRLAERVSVIVGARVQEVEARTRPTPGIDEPEFRSRDRTAVGTANLLVRAAPGLNLIGTVARGFRSPNLVERFFDGPTPEGAGYQRRNLDLEPETSLNVDVGARWRRGMWYAEGFVFRNNLRDGVAIEATGDSVNRIPAFQNVNVDRLRFSGFELAAGTRLLDAIDLAANFTKLDSKNVSEPNSPVGGSYSSKTAVDVAWRPSGDRFSLGYSLRRNGEQTEALAGSSVVGPVLPAFTVHGLRGRALLLDRGRQRTSLVVTVDNLTDELYAEFSNASFFRPEPRRSVATSLVIEF